MTSLLARVVAVTAALLLAACREQSDPSVQAAVTAPAASAAPTAPAAPPVAITELALDFVAGPEVPGRLGGGLIGITLDQFRARWATAATSRGLPAVTLAPNGILDRGYRDANAQLAQGLWVHALLVGSRELGWLFVRASPYQKGMNDQLFAAWEALIDTAQPGATAEDHRAIYRGLGLTGGKIAGSREFEHAGFRYLVARRMSPKDELISRVEPLPREVKPGAPLALSVPDGNLAGSGTVEMFVAMMSPASVGKPFAEALALCQAEGLDLCTEPQWQRACQEAPALSTVQTWTASFTRDFASLQTRGGGSCDAGAGAASTDANPARGALCCTRSIALSGKLPGFRGLASTVLAFERGLNLKSAELLEKAFAPSLVNYYLLSNVERTAVVRTSLDYVSKTPGSYRMHDRCEVKPELGPSPSMLECLHTSLTAAHATVTRAHYGFGLGGLEYVRDPMILRRRAAY